MWTTISLAFGKPRPWLTGMVKQLKPPGFQLVGDDQRSENPATVLAIHTESPRMLDPDWCSRSGQPNLGQLIGDRLPLARRSVLLIDNSREGIASNWTSVFRGLHQQTAELGLSLDRVILLQQNLNLEAAYHQWRADDGIAGPSPRFVWMHGYLVNLAVRQAPALRRWWCKGQALVDRLAAKPPERVFLSLNHRPRWHRLSLALYLVQTGLLDRGLVSFLDPQFADRDQLRKIHERRLLGRFPPAAIDQAIDTLHRLVPLRIPDDHPEDIAFDIGTAMMDRTWLSLVSETSMSNGRQRRFTEKSVKPLLGAHPCLILGECGSLSDLRSLGFQTFDGHIDETYDTEPNPSKRFHMVLAELERLCALSTDDLLAWREALVPRLIHNVDHALYGLPTLLGSRMFGELRWAIWDALRSLPAR